MLKKIFQPIDNAPLIIFRIFFGILFACESFGAILTGWVKANFITPNFTFSHIGFEWLQPLPGFGMYFYFIIMGVLSLFVAFGYRYKFSVFLLTVLWAGVYLMQKTSYNNHYYLLLLVGIMMFFLPANQFKSLDVKYNRTSLNLSMPRWCSLVMILQITIVYFYATLAKFYPDWLDGTFVKNLLSNKTPFENINYLFSQKWFYMFISYMGILFDGLIIPALLFKKTRTIAVIASLIFHIFNSVVLQIGIFPYFALSYAVFFYHPETIQKIFFKTKPKFTQTHLKDYSGANILKYFFIPYFIIQILLPIRHWFIKGDVLFTEEGHRLSWRMMLRSKNGFTNFKIIDKNSSKQLHVNINDFITTKQYNAFCTKPDMIWQMAQVLKKFYKDKGIDVAVYANTYVSVNGKESLKLIDNTVDLADVSWDYFKHSSWILLPAQYK